MKRLLPLFFVIAFFNSCTPFKFASIDEPFVKVFEGLPGDKNELFVKANEWMIGTFVDAKAVIQYYDKEEGVLIGKYQMHEGLSNGAPSPADTKVYATINIRLKDNKARLVIEPLSKWIYDKGNYMMFNYSKENALADIEALAEELYKTLSTATVEF